MTDKNAMRVENAKLEVEFEARNATEWFNQVAERLRSAATEVDRYRERFEQVVVDSTNVSPDDVLNWTVNALAGLVPNLRLDQPVRSAARLARALAVLKGEE